MEVDLLPQRLMAVLLSLPLVALLFVSISYWFTYGRQEKSSSGKSYIGYNKLYLTLVAIGYFGIWLFWLSGIVLHALDRYFTTLDFLVCSFLATSIAQIAGLVILYIGSLFFAWAIGYAGRYLRPSTSGVQTDHRLVQGGPLGIVRHPYYVSYMVILVGLSLTLATLWPLLLTLCVVIGMTPTANAEEIQLEALFGEEYRQYQRKVGQFFPKLFRR
ncbi:MAG: isoprenylcysteine carboxylmethyltransferase family protein [Anaerolineales bacterium]|nr:isoprenylcysteine carboxylmethyltransferase family protein [Anaerolineales bacterium]